MAGAGIGAAPGRALIAADRPGAADRSSAEGSVKCGRLGEPMVIVAAVRLALSLGGEPIVVVVSFLTRRNAEVW